MRFFVPSYDSSAYLQDLVIFGVTTWKVRKRPVAALVCVLSVSVFEFSTLGVTRVTSATSGSCTESV
jgi:hypothetical protein